MKTVKHTDASLPPVDDAALARLAKQSDAAIDTTDIPELSDAQLAAMVRAGQMRPVKQQITARLDADVLAWLKSGGKGYQSRMNAILRKAMLDAE